MRKQFKDSAEEFRDRGVVPFWGALDRYRSKYLRPYADVRETLHALHEAGIPVAIVSDAPAHMAVVAFEGRPQRISSAEEHKNVRRACAFQSCFLNWNCQSP